jgi:hypothetical protein
VAGDDDVMLAESPAQPPHARAALVRSGMPLAEQSLAGNTDWLGL